MQCNNNNYYYYTALQARAPIRFIPPCHSISPRSEGAVVVAKTYFDLIQEGYEVKAYHINNIEVQNGYILMLFVTILQKNNFVYECHEYQTLDPNMQTLEMTFICRELVQPYTKGLGT